jgi:hypothetical protein
MIGFSFKDIDSKYLLMYYKNIIEYNNNTLKVKTANGGEELYTCLEFKLLNIKMDKPVMIFAVCATTNSKDRPEIVNIYNINLDEKQMKRIQNQIFTSMPGD